ncbi:SOS response-associated peptidase [Marasmitruncus massiliensis]|uniref:SOS response-associated peptidase n=1 Tax=Marasmitruncus massiliensis TaxID=1944642 RepID=UPI000C7BCD98|nr:SOS response-associated peptidase [Marasmitruncus massiliensis]
MCGRYQFTAEESQDIRNIIAEVERKCGVTGMKTGEVYPTNLVPVLLPSGSDIVPELLSWGFPNFRNKGVIINARAETAQEKPMFKRCLSERRCVIPTTGFYEWDTTKKKYLFRLPEAPELYLAGLYNDFAGEQRFTILTTAANTSIADVHNRMPLVLPKEDVSLWLQNTAAAVLILNREPPMLVKQPVA